MFTAEISYCLQIERIAQGMGRHHCLGLIRQSRLQLRLIYIVLRQLDIYEYRHCSEVKSRCNRCRKACRYCYDLISALNRSVSQLVSCQSHKRKQIGG